VVADAIADLSGGKLADELEWMARERVDSFDFREHSSLERVLAPLRAAVAIVGRCRLYNAPAEALSGQAGFWDHILGVTRECLQPCPSPAATRARLPVLVYAVEAAAAGLHTAGRQPGQELVGLIREIFQGRQSSGTAGCLRLLLQSCSAEELNEAREAGVAAAVQGGQVAALAVRPMACVVVCVGDCIKRLRVHKSKAAALFQSRAHY
jgi:hypothetical protein